MPDLEDLENTVNTNQLTIWELILAIVVLIVFVFLARLARRRIRSYLAQHSDLDEYVPALIGRIASWAVMILGIIVALVILGFDMAPVVLVLLLIAGVLVLSGKGILENFAAGMLLQIRGPFRIGDRIEAKGYVGTVREINARAVIIDTGDRRTVHVPNKEVLDDPIVNYTEHPERRSDLEVGVAYDTDLTQGRHLLVEATQSVDGVFEEPTPQAYIDEFADSAVTLVVQFWHDDGARVEVRDRVAAAVKTAFDEAGIDMPFPQREVRLDQPDG
jgi:small-conductance mechanosensitive channel